MKIHHLNCGCLKPLGSRLFPTIFPEKVVCHCLLVETPQRLILIDSGLAKRDLTTPSRLGAMTLVIKVETDPALTAFEQIKKLGYSPADVTDVIPTHLDFDHAGGIEDFPEARVHLSAAEYQAWSTPRDLKLKQRYKTVRFSHEVKWQIYDESLEWMGFRGAQPQGLPKELVCVKLPGHTPGHYGVALETREGWMLHAGDAYYDHRELSRQKMPLGLSLFQKVAHYDFATAMRTQQQLADLKNVKVFCAHDPEELSAQT